LAIGRGGQNRRLTGKLTGYEVEIIKESEYRKMVEEQRGKEVPLELVEGLSETMVSKLYAAGLKTVQDVLDQGEDGLLQIKGIGEKTAKRIWALISEREAGASGADTAEEPAEAEEAPAVIGDDEAEEVGAEAAESDEIEEEPSAAVEVVEPSSNGEVEAEHGDGESSSPEEQPQVPEEAETSGVSEGTEKTENQ
jgi:hypothetical protein